VSTSARPPEGPAPSPGEDAAQHPSRMALARLFGSSVIDQALLSAANFAVGLILLRYSSETQYSYYILAFNAMMLLTTLQGSFIGTPLVIRLPRLDEAERRQWLGSLLRDQRRWGLAGGLAALAGTALAAWRDALPGEAWPVVPAAIALVLASLYREYFRSVLQIYHRPHGVLAADTLYVAGIVAGAALAVRHAQAAALVLLASTAAAVASGLWLRAQLRGDIDAGAAGGRLREIARAGFWAASGGVVYWLFNQGYSFLTAATLDLGAVAALAASRLLMMPANLLSAGVQKQLAPLASAWLAQAGAAATARRLYGFAAGMGLATLLYAAAVWLMRDWIFLDVMRKDFAERDAMLLLWSALFVLMAVRSPPMLLAILRQRLPELSAATLASALLALALSYAGMLRWGAPGAIVGIIAGEFFYCLATAWLVRREVRRAQIEEGGSRPG